MKQIFEDKNDPRVYHREAVQRIVPIGKVKRINKRKEDTIINNKMINNE